jgi:hypothetical protein
VTDLPQGARVGERRVTEAPEELWGGRPEAVYVSSSKTGRKVKGKLTKGLAVFEDLPPGTYFVVRVDEGLLSEEDADTKIYGTSKYEVGNVYEFTPDRGAGWNLSNVQELKHDAGSGWEPVLNRPAFQVAAGKVSYLGVLRIHGVCRRYIIHGQISEIDPRKGPRLDFDPREGVWSAEVDSSPPYEAHALDTLHKHYHGKPWGKMIEDRISTLKSEASHDSVASSTGR